MLYTKGDLAIQFEDIGEGLNGDYNPDDPNDMALLRFDASALGEIKERHGDGDCEDQEGGWRYLEDSSYCTLLSTTLNDDERRKAADLIIDFALPRLKDGRSPKHVFGECSWISDEDVKNGTFAGLGSPATGEIGEQA
jgi:hypothetical protein